MSKSIYIPKGQECHMTNLVCDNLVVNGSLRVDGEIRTKNIYGSGFIRASAVFAKTITFNTLDCGMIATGALIASHVTAVDIHATRGMSVSLFTKALCVKAGKIMITDAEIENLDAKAIQPPKQHDQVIRRIIAVVLALRIARLCRLSQRYMMAETETDASDIPAQSDAASDADLLNDQEFLRLRAMYKLAQETDYIWQIVPKKVPTAKVVTLADRFAEPDDDNAA